MSSDLHKASLKHDIQQANDTQSLIPVIKTLDLEKLKEALCEMVDAASEKAVSKIYFRSSSLFNIIGTDAFQNILEFVPEYSLPVLCAVSKDVQKICKKIYAQEGRGEPKYRWISRNFYFKKMFQDDWLKPNKLYTNHSDAAAALDMPKEEFPLLYFYVNEYPRDETPDLRGRDAVIMKICKKFDFPVRQMIYCDAHLCCEDGNWWRDYPQWFCSDDEAKSEDEAFGNCNLTRWRYSNFEDDDMDIPVYRIGAFEDTNMSHIHAQWNEYGHVHRAMYIVGPSASWRRTVLKELRGIRGDETY